MTHTTHPVLTRAWPLAAGLALAAGLGAGAVEPAVLPPTIRSSTIVDSQDASTRRGTRHRSALRHARELVLLAGRSHAERPSAERQYGGRGAGLELVHQSARDAGRSRWTSCSKGRTPPSGPAPGNWTVIAAKNDGVTPGFRIRDSNGQVWFLKFDPPGYRAMATGTEVVVTKLFWALGYFTCPRSISPRSGPNS